MDRAEEIMLELLAVAQGLDPAIPVELDRHLDIAEEDLPLIIVRSGEEEAAPASGAPQIIFDRRWIMRPEVEIYIRQFDATTRRAELNQLWAAFRTGFKSSRILSLVAQGSLPEMRKTTVQPGESAETAGLLVELGLTFDR